MSSTNKYRLGILAYGSLIDDPGEELSKVIVDRIKCTTPFTVEFARLSKSRDGAPTLIPMSDAGGNVNAQILVLSDEVSTNDAETMLWRRESRSSAKGKKYSRPQKPSIDSIVIESIEGFQSVATVLYTSIRSNMGIFLKAEYLASFAIQSAVSIAGEGNKDGISYLIAAKQNGIITPLMKDYESEILRQTQAKDLEDARRKLTLSRPDALAEVKRQAALEKQLVEIADLVFEYGIITTIGQKEIDPKEIPAFLKENNKRFIANCHNGFRKAQDKVLPMLISIQDEILANKERLKNAHRSKNKREVAKFKSRIKRAEFEENIIRHLMDGIVWQMIGRQLYISRRLFQGVEGTKILKHSNIQSVVDVSNEINANEMDFALISDLTGYVQSGDLLCIKDGALVIAEVKEGEKNHKMLNILHQMQLDNAAMEDVQEKYALDKNELAQLQRQLRQVNVMSNITDIISKDEGIDNATGTKMKIITPKEPTPMFIERLAALRKQLDERNLFAYDVIEDCLHIGLYKGYFRNIGSIVLKTLAEQSTTEYILVDFLSVVESLNKPLFTLPFEKEFIFDILFGRIKLYFLVDITAYMKIYSEYGMKAEWGSRKETMRAKELHKQEGMFVMNNRGVKITMESVNEEMWLFYGTFHRMIFEQIYPSYTAYSSLYHFEELALKKSENKNQQEDKNPAK